MYYKSKIVRKLDGTILKMIRDGVSIIEGGRVVDQEAYDEYVRQQEDKKEAIKAVSKAKKVDAETIAQRNQTATVKKENDEKLIKLEKKVADQDKKLDAILKAINDKK